MTDDSDNAPPEAAGYPVTLRLAGRSVLVAGGGRIAARRVERLLKTGARVVVIAPDVLPALSEAGGAGALVWHCREVREADHDHPRSPGPERVLCARRSELRQRAIDIRLTIRAFKNHCFRETVFLV